MELSRREVPLYGRVKVCPFLQAPGLNPDEAEFYVVLEGSTLDHITVAQRAGDGHALHFVAPGHNLFEMVSVTAYIYTEGRLISCLDKAPLEYILDDAQELAEFLVTHSHCLSTRSYLDVLSRFRLTDDAALKTMDVNVTRAMANLDYPYTWNVLGSQPGEELQPRESLLHLTVRLGLFHVTQLLLCQPGGLMAVALPNDEGDTPLKLAKESEQQAILELLTNPPSPLVTPLAGMTQVWVNSSQLLRFCHESETLTLTVQQASERNQQDSILLFRNRLRNENFLREIKVLTKSGLEEKCEREDTKDTRNNKDWFKDLCTGDHTLEDSVFEEQLVLSLDEEDEPAPFYSEKGQSESFRRSPAQSTFNAAARLSAMLNGKDQIYANSMLVDQVDDLDIKYRIAGVTGDSTRTDSRGPDFTGGSLHEPAAHFQGTGPSCSGTGPLCVKEKGVREQSFPAIPAPSLSPAQLALARLNNPPLADTFSLRGSSPRDTCALSPSLVALELDSEEDDQLNQCPFSCASTSPQSGGPLLASSGDEPDSFHASPDFSCSRTHSSSFNHPPTKDLGEPGIRLRSYSYSSPKISLVQPRVHRDTAISDLSEDGVFYSSGRSLLQALSLSKSLSLLNPVKQRALGSPEQPQDKRELSFRKRAQSAEDEGSVALADSLQHLTLSEFLKEIEEEEWDKYIIPSKSESEKYKVSRTFSFLKSRMSSTRNKNKGKGKEKECKEKAMNGHQFAAASCSGLTLCLVCDKPAAGKDLLQCSNCTINIHKGCRDSATPCMKKLQDKYALTAKNKTPSHTATSAARESSTACPIPTSTSLPVMVSRDKREQAGLPNTLSKSVPVVTERRLSEGLEMDTETGTWRNRSQSEELLAVMESSPSTDSSIIEDTVDAPLRNDFRADLLDYEAESWSLAVDQEFCKKHDKRVIKRQDVIYELMQTEMHHIQTLTIMAEVFRKGMKEELQLDVDTVDKIFPCLDELSDFHRSFFCAMKERRQNCTQEDNDKNFLIDRIGDILVQQFSNENAEKMKQVYGEFCSHHTEAVNFFKELQQQNKKFQVFIKQQSNNSLVRRREIPECILLVTQRITKYPVLLERILQHTQEGTEDNADLSRALPLIRDIIAAVDLRVSEFEKEQKLLDVLNRMENKSFAKLKNGHAFRKQDLLCQARTLKHEGLVYWKTATGRLKDVLALLLTDTLIFLQEKDQKFIFAVVDQKPPVISLQKLIVREVANEERGMFLISASAAGPEMYEVHTASKEDRNSWMRLIREAVESCPVEEEENTSESEEDRRAAEARANKIHKLQETLSTQDQQICSNLEDKLKIYAELMRMNINEENIPEPRLLVQPSPDDTPQAALLLTAALREAEKLTATLTTWPFSSTDASQESPTEPSSPVKLADFAAFQESSAGSDCMNTQSSSSVSQASDWEARGVGWTGADNLILQSLTAFRSGEANSINLKVAQSVQSLTQLLYSLQAAVTMQDSCFEVQKVLLQESERLPRGNALQEQEKQRNLEKQREELAGVLRLQGRLRQEQQRWQRECEQRRRQQEALEGRLAQREQECQRQAQRLQQEREELECQLREYQQSLERLREGQRLVGRERERLETQQRLLQSWRHNRQRSLPVMMIPVDGAQDSSHGQCVSFDGQGSVFVNEAALRTPLNNRHLHQHHRSGSLVYPDTPSAHNSLNALIGHAQDRPPQQHTDLSQHLLTHSYSRRTGNAARMGLGEHGRDPANNDVKTGEKWSTGASVSGAGLFQGLLQPTAASPLLQLQTCAPVESGNGEDGVEENIVYL